MLKAVTSANMVLLWVLAVVAASRDGLDFFDIAGLLGLATSVGVACVAIYEWSGLDGA